MLLKLEHCVVNLLSQLFAVMVIIVQKAVNSNDQENWFYSSFQTFKGNITLETDIKHNYIPGSLKLIIWTLLVQTQGNNSTISNKIWCVGFCHSQ